MRNLWESSEVKLWNFGDICSFVEREAQSNIGSASDATINPRK
jgi:hypothetical protein